MNEQVIVALIGYGAAGKDVVAKYLTEEYNFHHFNFSDSMVDELERRGWPDTKDNRSRLGAAWRKETGNQGIVALKLAEKLRDSCHARIVLTGMRSPEELTLFRAEYGRVVPVYIEASFELRRGRRDDSSCSDGGLANRDQRDRETMGLGRLIDEEMYDYKILNEGTKDELYSQLDSLMKNLQ